MTPLGPLIAWGFVGAIGIALLIWSSVEANRILSWSKANQHLSKRSPDPLDGLLQNYYHLELYVTATGDGARVTRMFVISVIGVVLSAAAGMAIDAWFG